jgi:hypothetical protein
MPPIPSAKVVKTPGSYSPDKTKNGKVTPKKSKVGRPAKKKKGRKFEKRREKYTKDGGDDKAGAGGGLQHGKG